MYSQCSPTGTHLSKGQVNACRSRQSIQLPTGTGQGTLRYNSNSTTASHDRLRCTFDTLFMETAGTSRCAKFATRWEITQAIATLETSKLSRKDKLKKFSDWVKNNKINGNRICQFYLLGLCHHRNNCRMRHEEETLPSSIACALPRASKNRLQKWGLSHDATACKAGGQGRCKYSHQDLNQDLNKHTYEALEEDPNIIS